MKEWPSFRGGGLSYAIREADNSSPGRVFSSNLSSMKLTTSLITVSFLLFSVLTTSCNPPEIAARNNFPGRWAMIRVLDQGIDVTAEHNPERDRWIEFQADGSFVSDGNPYGRNTGKWKFDPVSKELFLDSDAGEEDDSYWIVRFNDKQMNWQGTRFEFSRRFRIEFRRMETR